MNQTKKIKNTYLKKIYSNKKRINKYKLKGGEKIGEGGYGCVVRPAIPCSSATKKNIHNKVSKLILNYKPKSYKKELQKLDYIKKIDPENKYCISYLEECALNTNIALTDRVKDVIKVQYSNFKRNSNQFTIENTALLSPQSNTQKKAIKRNYCLIDPSQPYEYRNQIQLYGGEKIKPRLQNINNKYISDYTFIKKYYIHIFKHLLLGLKLLHSKKIIHRDIKLDNMVYKIDDNKNLPYFKYIDFGLSDNLNINKDIHLSGTPGYMPIDYILFYEMFLYNNNNYDLKNNNIKNKILSYIIEKYIEKINFIVTSYNSGAIKNLLNKPFTLKTINGKKVIKHKYKTNKNQNLEYLMITDTQLEKLYNRFLLYIKTKKYPYSDLLFSDYKGMVYKTDIFALGVVFGMILNFLNIKNAKMLSLIKQMMHYDSTSRPTINDILKNKLFTSVNTSKPIATTISPKKKMKT